MVRSGESSDLSGKRGMGVMRTVSCGASEDGLFGVDLDFFLPLREVDLVHTLLLDFFLGFLAAAAAAVGWGGCGVVEVNSERGFCFLGGGSSSAGLVNWSSSGLGSIGTTRGEGEEGGMWSRASENCSSSSSSGAAAAARWEGCRVSIGGGEGW